MSVFNFAEFPSLEQLGQQVAAGLCGGMGRRRRHEESESGNCTGSYTAARIVVNLQLAPGQDAIVQSYELLPSLRLRPQPTNSQSVGACSCSWRS